MQSFQGEAGALNVRLQEWPRGWETQGTPEMQIWGPMFAGSGGVPREGPGALSVLVQEISRSNCTRFDDNKTNCSFIRVVSLCTSNRHQNQR